MPAYVEIEFEQGNPVAVDGERLAPVALLEALNRLGGEHGIGRVDLVENRFVGHEVARRLRDARRHDPARGAPRARVHHARPRGAAPARLARARATPR